MAIIFPFDLLRHIQEKKALIDQEPLFYYADQLLSGTRRTNQEWVEILSIPPASFGRIKRHFVLLLEEQYHLTIGEKDNQIQGSEPAIRQFMYDFYFTLPLCPNVLDQRIESWDSFEQPTKTGCWSLDPIRLNQWDQLAKWRIDQGQCLQLKNGQEEVQERIVVTLDEATTLTLTSTRKSSLISLGIERRAVFKSVTSKRIYPTVFF